MLYALLTIVQCLLYPLLFFFSALTIIFIVFSIRVPTTEGVLVSILFGALSIGLWISSRVIKYIKNDINNEQHR